MPEPINGALSQTTEIGALTSNPSLISQALKARNSQEPEVMRRAIQQYPYLAGKGIRLIQSPIERSGGNMLEFWGPGNTGDEKAKRPSSIPIDSVGIELFGDKATPLDILGDYVSHEAVKSDPKLKSLYENFSSVTPEAAMQDRYKWHQQNAGEKRPFEEWKAATGLPELFRGYTFNQFGPNAHKYYTPEQLQILDQVKNLVGIKDK